MRYLVFGLIALTALVESANILALFPMPGKSHFVMFERLLTGLAKKGHDVDVVTHFTAKDKPPGYNELSISGSIPIFANNVSVDAFKHFSESQMISFITHETGVDNCKIAFNTQVVRDLKKTTKKYDLVITEIFGSDCMAGFGYLFGVPTVSVISSVTLPWASDRFGNPDNPAYIPSYFSEFAPRMDLWERIQNTISVVKAKFLYNFWTYEISDRLAREFFGQSLPPLKDLIKNTSLVLVNSHFSMNGARPTVPNFIEVGGLHVTEPKPLTQYFENLLTTDIKNGIIYLTMGSMILTESFTPSKLQGMFDAFAELPYKILWKATREKFPKTLTIPANIHFETWMPQMDILCHPNVKLFVSHGGLMGSQEAVYCGVPRLGIPIFADQENNIRSSEKLGLAIRVGYDDISKKTVSEATKKLLYDPTYKNKAELAASQFKDRPLSPLDTAVYWVEYVIRHKGAPELRSAAADLPWYKYYLIDVGLILVSVFSSVMYFVFCVVKLIANLISSGSSNKLKTN